MVFANDKALYTVAYLVAGQLKRETFETFAAAAGCADALSGIRFIDVEFYQVDDEGGRSSISGSLYCYGRNGTRRVCNQYLVNQATKRGGR